MFPVVWTPLYLLMAVSGWLVWREAGLFVLPFIPYGVQLVLNAAWSAIFFGLRRPDLAFIEVVALWLSIAATIVAFAPISPVAAWLLAPYLLWVTIASVLNAHGLASQSRPARPGLRSRMIQSRRVAALALATTLLLPGLARAQETPDARPTLRSRPPWTVTGETRGSCRATPLAILSTISPSSA